jgi:hypothetical protein
LPPSRIRGLTIKDYSKQINFLQNLASGREIDIYVRRIFSRSVRCKGISLNGNDSTAGAHRYEIMPSDQPAIFLQDDLADGIDFVFSSAAVLACNMLFLSETLRGGLVDS